MLLDEEPMKHAANIKNYSHLQKINSFSIDLQSNHLLDSFFLLAVLWGFLISITTIFLIVYTTFCCQRRVSRGHSQNANIEAQIPSPSHNHRSAHTQGVESQNVVVRQPLERAGGSHALPELTSSTSSASSSSSESFGGVWESTKIASASSAAEAKRRHLTGNHNSSFMIPNDGDWQYEMTDLKVVEVAKKAPGHEDAASDSSFPGASHSKDAHKESVCPLLMSGSHPKRQCSSSSNPSDTDNAVLECYEFDLLEPTVLAVYSRVQDARCDYSENCYKAPELHSSHPNPSSPSQSQSQALLEGVDLVPINQQELVSQSKVENSEPSQSRSRDFSPLQLQD